MNVKDSPSNTLISSFRETGCAQQDRHRERSPSIRNIQHILISYAIFQLLSMWYRQCFYIPVYLYMSFSYCKLPLLQNKSLLMMGSTAFYSSFL